jgi:ABC-2 type transport system permease protein
MKWWRSVVSQEIRKILAYRSDFWVTFLGQTLIQLVVARALWQSVFEANKVSTMQGFTLEGLTLYYILAPIGTRMLLGESFGYISREIYDGTFTKYLLYPLSFIQYKSLTYLTNSLFFGLQIFMAVLLFQLFYAKTPVTFEMILHLLTGIGLFFLGATVYLSLGMCLELCSLWVDNVWSLMVVLRFLTACLGGGYIPLSFYPEWGVTLMKLTPFPYVVSLPIRTIMGQSTSSEVVSGVLVMVFWWFVFRIAVHIIWKFGQKSYTGVGQ